jgi:hypothetical protein
MKKINPLPDFNQQIDRGAAAHMVCPRTLSGNGHYQAEDPQDD